MTNLTGASSIQILTKLAMQLALPQTDESILRNGEGPVARGGTS